MRRGIYPSPPAIDGHGRCCCVLLMHVSHNVSLRRYRLAPHHLREHHGLRPRLSFGGCGVFLFVCFFNPGDIRPVGETSTRSVSLLPRVAGMKAAAHFDCGESKGFGRRLQIVRLSCGRLSLSSHPARGSLARRVYKGKGQPRGLIITRATTSLQ